MTALTDTHATLPALILGAAWAVVVAVVVTAYLRDARRPSDDGTADDDAWGPSTLVDPRHPSLYGRPEPTGRPGDPDGSPLGAGDATSTSTELGRDANRARRSTRPSARGSDRRAADRRSRRRQPDEEAAPWSGPDGLGSAARPTNGRRHADPARAAADGTGPGGAGRGWPDHRERNLGRSSGTTAGRGAAAGAIAGAGGRDDDGPVISLGRAIRRAGRRPADPAADRRVGVAAVGALVLGLVAPVLAVAPVAWAVVGPGLAARRAARQREAAVVDQFPDVVDLLVLTTSAGLPVPAALDAIGARPGGPLGPAIAAAADHMAHGGTTAEALDRLLVIAGPVAHPLIDALVEHDRYGTPLRPILERVVVEARAKRRRHAEEAARRLPVTLLFPLVLTTLPAFFLLAIVPLIAGSLGSLGPLVP